MPRITIIYEKPEGADPSFDFDYYVNEHLRLTEMRLADFGLLSWTVQKSERTMRGTPDIVAITHLDFRDAETMSAGFAEHGEELQADFGAYTKIVPRMVLCEIYGRSQRA